MVKAGILLGHKIFKNGIEVDKAKVDVIAKLPHPATIKDGDIKFLKEENPPEQSRLGILLVKHVAAAARNIELLHESGNSNKQDRDGNRVQNRRQGQQEIRGQKRSTETLPPLPLCATCGKPHPSVCY
nr:zinc finger, CCHC-type, retrotransposon Gag domain protein [Tanacetum cinerariifolium]